MYFRHKVASTQAYTR